MLAPYEWIRDYAAVVSDPQALADKMIMIGNGVEGLQLLGEDIRNVVVGRIEQITRHPNADKLVICQLDVGGDDLVQIVTGAPNVFEGAYVPVALAPAQLPDGPIKKGKLRGEASNGMLCSGSELHITEEDYPGAGVDGILILEGDLRPGTDIRDLLGLRGAVIDFEVGANRPDCLSILGIAMEAAAADEVAFEAPDVSYETVPAKTEDAVRVEVAAPDLCTRYMACAVKDVKIAPSPGWMQKRLEQAGIRPINNIVDITNFVMLETGQPMHAFDASKIRGNKIIVRRAENGEKMATLDGTERTFTDSMLLICDAEGPVGVAGIMGGLDSEITDETTSVIFEAAKFGYGNIRQTSRALGIATESSMRFSKGVDAKTTEEAMRRALHLVQELDAGAVLTGIIDILSEDLSPRIIKTTGAKINAILGTDISAREMQQLLEKVHIHTGLIGDELICTIPHYRGDIAGPNDIAEEVARMYGYDRIPETDPVVHLKAGKITPEERQADRIREYLVDQGFFECLTYSFAGRQDYDRICMLMPESVKLRNPLGDDTAYMRRSLLPGMLNTAAMNLARKNETLRLFELSRLFIPQEGEPLPEERRALSLCTAGDADFVHLKGIIENIVLLVSGRKLHAEAAETGVFSPAASAVLSVDGKEIGSMGEISSGTARNYGIETRVFAAQIDLTALLAVRKSEVRYHPIGRFPAARRDLAVVVRKEVGVGDLLEAVRRAGGSELEKAELMSVYEGPGVADGSKSAAFALTFRSPKGTMTDEQTEERIRKILKRLEKDFDAQLR